MKPAGATVIVLTTSLILSLVTEVRIAVGSTNPVKIAAARNVVKRIYGNGFEVIPVKVESGVSHTPIGEEEIVRGAKNRAVRALEAVEADLGIGMEGGIARKFGRWFLTGWCAAVDRDGYFYLGSSVYMQLPSIVVERVLRGEELGPVIDDITGMRDTKKTIGAIGILTKSLLTRQMAWEAALTYALVGKISPEFYS